MIREHIIFIDLDEEGNETEIEAVVKDKIQVETVDYYIVQVIGSNDLLHLPCTAVLKMA